MSAGEQRLSAHCASDFAEFEANINGLQKKWLTAEICLPLFERLDMLPGELSGSKPVDIDEEGGCDENDDVPEEVMLGINLILKELSEMFLNMESTKDKSLEAHPSFKRSMPIHCHLEKNLHSKL